MIDLLIQKLNSLSQLNDMLKERISAVAYVENYKAGDIILRDGDTCKRIALVAKGLTRSYYINDGQEITSRFIDEGSILTSWISYYTQKPGNEFIEATEDTALVCINYTDIEKMYADFPESNIIGRKQVEYTFYLSEQRTQMLRKHTAEERYRLFIDTHSTLLQRVSLKHIASYLGMSQETLSRVRSKYHKNS